MSIITYRQLQRLPARKLASMASENGLTVKVDGRARYLLRLIDDPASIEQEITENVNTETLDENHFGGLL